MTAAIYARKSTEQNGVADESKSVARQVDHARAYAEWIGPERAAAWLALNAHEIPAELQTAAEAVSE